MSEHCHLRSGPGYTCAVDACARLYGRVFAARWGLGRWESWRHEFIYRDKLGLRSRTDLGRRSGLAV